MNKKSEVKNDCFAAREKECDCLDVKMEDCPGGKCPFYKTKRQEVRCRLRARKRIEKLPTKMQSRIWDKYFR